jgi:hypothetical protein
MAFWLWRVSGSRATLVWSAVLLYAFYLFTPENCHCQRDLWMLLPATVALYLRRRQIVRAASGSRSLRSAAGWAVVEGICWGLAFWIKPFVAVPGMVCWLVSLIQIRRARPGAVGLLTLDAAGLLAGGLLAGGLGTLWLWQSGSWPYFWDTMLQWNREYYATSGTADFRIYRLRKWLVGFFPWSLVHGIALPLAVVYLWRGLFRRQPAGPLGAIPPAEPLLAAFYVAWLIQALCLQHPHDYVLASSVIPALLVIAAWGRLPGRSLAGWSFVLVFIGFAVLTHPLANPHRLAVWRRCFMEGSSPVVRDRLAMEDGSPSADWRELEEVAAFLRGQGVKDHELLCWGDSTHPLYLELGVEPAVRYFHFTTVLRNFPAHREVVQREVENGGERFVVSDLFLSTAAPEHRLPRSQLPPRKVRVEKAPEHALALPAGFPKEYLDVFPWHEPVVFRSGRYYVHRVTVPARRIWIDRGSPEK